MNEMTDDPPQHLGACAEVLMAELKRQGVRPEDISEGEDLSAVMIFDRVDLRRLAAAVLMVRQPVPNTTD